MTTKRYHAMPASARASVQRCCSDADLTARFVREVVPLRERLCRHAFGLTHDHYEAEDLVQETMLKACSAFQSFQPGTNLKAWLLRIMINSHINHCRKARRHPLLSASASLPTGSWRRSARHELRRGCIRPKNNGSMRCRTTRSQLPSERYRSSSSRWCITAMSRGCPIRRSGR